jgi:hypothetical protein
MRQALRVHPGAPSAAAIAVESAAERRGALLQLTYVVTGDLGALYLPPTGAPTRADELWRRTCFEAFVRPGADEAYFEFNFAPTRWWAAYSFDRYREGMAVAGDIVPSQIEAHTHADRFELHVELELATWPADGAWRLGLTAVIEELNGEKSYWALAHPPQKPDFHHPDGFVLKLPAGA